VRYIQISEPVFRDLMSAKSKLTDITIVLSTQSRIPKNRLLEKLNRIIYSQRYKEDDNGR
jgi:hypothetical protein